MNNKTPSFVNGYFGHVLRESTVHGVKYIGLPNRHIVERSFWIISVLSLVCFSIYLVEDVYTKFFANPVIISFQPKETDVAQIPFPAITICNVNILKRKVVKDIVDLLKKELENGKKSNESTEALKDALVLSEHLAHYCKSAPSFRRVLEQKLVDSFGESDVVEEVHNFLEKHIVEELMDLQEDEMSDTLRYNVTYFLDQAAHDCEDMILKCMWAREELPCKEIFFNIHTQHGSCCTFNMMPQFILRKIPENDSSAEREKKLFPEDEIRQWKNFGKNGKIVNFEKIDQVHYPRHQKSGGKPYGLSILLNPEIDMYGTCNTHDAWGFKMVAHSPISFPSVMDYGSAVPPSNEVFVDIEPLLSIAEEDELATIDIEKRGCYFPKDKQAKLDRYKFYTAPNCMDECIARITYRNCSCVRYFMPKNSTQNLCGAKHLECAEQVRENLTSTGRAGHCSDCKPACTEIKYKMKISHFPLRESEFSTFNYTTADANNKIAQNYSIVHIFFGADKVYAKERKRLYDAADLLANAGGLISLTLGISIVSFIEIVYFCSLRAWFYFKSEGDHGETENQVNKAGNQATVVRAAIQDGFPKEKSMVGYYNWAMTATNATKIMVKPVQPEGILRRKAKPNKPISFFGTRNEPLYPYLS